jgi:lipopolysaccharide transport system ATP-binding protein
METCILATFNGISATLEMDSFYGKTLAKGLYKSTCVIPANFLNDKTYSINAFLVPVEVVEMGIAERVLSFSISETGEMRKEYTGEWIGMIRPKLSWQTIKL